ncbi:MAG: 3-methyl-2-oxobutanoate dehydrogenase subunit VorB [Anaerolineae bacterium]|nr:3-methyl-2-oxobutanoate dehydrogenase subunit VorB [Thermoflexales bacterium]MDW8408851.1 3-methyl-2-oxobutanoate dehydrogenase subunit VorB [Anaerolineae bacterium]
MARQLMKGNEAIAEAAIRAGVEAYFGYPITPQTELLEYMSRRMPELGRVFLQAESELAAINMVYGAACAGRRAMTSSSSPGISLMQEGLSYIAASEVPAVIVDVMRGGPGLGNIAPSQSDYLQMVKMAGHGDFKPIVLAPATVPEAVQLTGLAFELAERYRTIVTVLLDGVLGQMMEPVELPPMRPLPAERPAWSLTGAGGRAKNVILPFRMQPDDLETLNVRLQRKIADIAQHETRYKEYLIDEADEPAELIVVAFGTAGRIALSAVKEARQKGIRVGLHRPITLSPFPDKRLSRLADEARGFLVVEMNAGQMLEDVRLAVGGQAPVRFVGRMGGQLPMPEDILQAIEKLDAEAGRLLDHKIEGPVTLLSTARLQRRQTVN